MRVRHFGNTANNAYYNARLLKESADIESELPVQMFGLQHAISAPAWEAVDFEVPDAEWVAEPDWSSIAGATQVNADYSDLTSMPEATDETATPTRRGARSILMSMARAGLAPLYGKRWAQPIFDLSYRLVLARRPTLAPSASDIEILYGADSLIRLKVSEVATPFVCVEHGTVRWIADGDRETAAFRRAYRELVGRAQHLWVTNLDPRSLEIAEDVAPGRWSALPHPFIPDARVPFAESRTRRNALLQKTRSQSLVLLPSSQNWSKHHDKGSKKALTAFVELRRAGVDVGLVAVEWGLQVAESRAFLDEAGVTPNVVWVAPMARFSLQRMMADVDVVWDQFGLPAFGALALRAVEQGTPMISRGLAPIGEQLIGGPVPWQHAETTEDIVRETTLVLEHMSRRGRATVIAESTKRYRSWLLERHSSSITAELQREVYTRIVDGSFERGASEPDRWATLLGAKPHEES